MAERLSKSTDTIHVSINTREVRTPGCTICRLITNHKQLVVQYVPQWSHPAIAVLNNTSTDNLKKVISELEY